MQYIANYLIQFNRKNCIKYLSVVIVSTYYLIYSVGFGVCIMYINRQ